jgi:hypothetical protein
MRYSRSNIIQTTIFSSHKTEKNKKAPYDNKRPNFNQNWWRCRE